MLRGRPAYHKAGITRRLAIVLKARAIAMGPWGAATANAKIVRIDEKIFHFSHRFGVPKERWSHEWVSYMIMPAIPGPNALTIFPAYAHCGPSSI
jgi:hypothetical protein